MKRSEDSRRKRSPWEFALIDYDTGQVVYAWRRVWKTSLLLVERDKPEYRSRVTDMPPRVHARRPGDPASARRINPLELVRRGGAFHHSIEFPRRRSR